MDAPANPATEELEQQTTRTDVKTSPFAHYFPRRMGRISSAARGLKRCLEANLDVAMTREDLFDSVYIGRYNPRKDSNLVCQLIFELRKALGEVSMRDKSASAPRYLVTTKEGYMLKSMEAVHGQQPWP